MQRNSYYHLVSKRIRNRTPKKFQNSPQSLPSRNGNGSASSFSSLIFNAMTFFDNSRMIMFLSICWFSYCSLVVADDQLPLPLTIRDDDDETNIHSIHKSSHSMKLVPPWPHMHHGATQAPAMAVRRDVADRDKIGNKVIRNSDNGRMVILRTFCPFDIDKLADGFDSWSSFFPCESTHASESLLNVDILLFFSASWELWPKAKETSEEIVRKFNEGYYPWARCFGEMSIDTALMSPDQDLYDPPKQQVNRLWVNGPNRQFEKGLRACQFPSDAPTGYQLAYLMEPDSVPLQRFWLDRLRREIEERRPFAVLGSKYRGDNWYDFFNELALPLINHLNGNAVYNISHTLMNLMLSQLEVEADEMYNFIPFDLRMAQMWTEGTMGVVNSMLPSGMLENLVEGVITPRNNTALFQSWWDAHGYFNDQSVMQESMVIKNYAATNMLPKFLGPETIIHGAAMFQRWDSRKPMGLVVSDWDEGFLDGFIHSLAHDQHPFREVVVMRPEHAEKISHDLLLAVAQYGITIRFVERQHRDYMDWCEAPVEAEWFMYVNTYFNVRKYVDLLLTEEEKPLMSYIYSDLPFCQNYESCKSAVERARNFYPDADKHVQDFEMVFNTDERDHFCSLWHGLDLPPPEDPCVPQGPTATAYLAYLSSRRKAKKLYKMKDKAQFGWRNVFKHVHESFYIDKCSSGRRLADGNVTACRDIEDPVECEDNPECEYDYQFLTCFESGAPLPTSSPTISPAPTITPSPTSDTVTFLPTTAPTTTTNSPDPTLPPTIVRSPSLAPNYSPSPSFTLSPTLTPLPSSFPSTLPTTTVTPSLVPSSSPYPTVTYYPTETPTLFPTPSPTSTPSSLPSSLICVDPSLPPLDTNISCNEPLVISFISDGGAADVCETFTLEVYSSSNQDDDEDILLETVSVSSIGQLSHLYPNSMSSSRRKLGGTATKGGGDEKSSVLNSFHGIVNVESNKNKNKNLKSNEKKSKSKTSPRPSVLKEQHSSTEFNTFTFQSPLATSPSPPRMIIVRPFSPWDIDKLETSFDDWEKHLPCVPQHTQNAGVDILLFFSASFGAWPRARLTAQGILDKFHEGAYRWGICFENMFLDTASLSRTQDIYEPMMQNRDLFWVNGPNRQFEAAAAAVKNPSFTKTPYELFYLMEPDSVPWQTGWLDKLMNELELRRPFAVMGSKYHGYKWHDFEFKLPLPLLHHLNGNAIYNITHDLTQLMFGQLSDESAGLFNMIPFDLRMGQMWMEGTLGFSEDMLPDVWNGTSLDVGSFSWANNTAKFKNWWRLHGFHKGKPAMQETSLIRNYAATNMLKHYLLGSETITHGANMYNRWNADEHGSIGLVISDWGNEKELTRMLNSIATADHPFREVMVLTSEVPTSDLEVDWDKLYDQDISITLVNREMSKDSMDWCFAPIQSEWFMYANSYFRLRSMIDIMVTDDGRPLIPFIYSDSPYCQEFPACVSSMERARIFDPDADKHVQDFDMIFQKDLRDDFCQSWTWQNMPDPGDACVPQGPTASAYFAFVSATRRVRKTYKLNDKSIYGYRNVFLRLSSPFSSCESGRRLSDGNETEVNETACLYYDTEVTCDAQLPTCVWSSLYSMCYSMNDPLILPSPSPTTAPSATYTPTISPTTLDTSSVAVSFTMVSNSQPTLWEETTLKQSISNLTGIPIEDFLSFSIISVRRKLTTEIKEIKEETPHQKERKLLSGISSEVSFTVTLSLEVMNETIVEELITLIEDTIEGDDFATALTTNIDGAEIESESLTIEDMTRTPSPTSALTITTISWNSTLTSFYVHLIVDASQQYNSTYELLLQQGISEEYVLSGAYLTEFIETNNDEDGPIYEWNLIFGVIAQLPSTHYCTTNEMFNALKETFESSSFESTLISVTKMPALTIIGHGLSLTQTELYVKTFCNELPINCSSTIYHMESCNTTEGTCMPTNTPTSAPTNDTWTIGTWIPTPAPTAIPSPSPTITEYPTITAPPTVLPTLSLVPSLAPSLQPTTENFTCANVWDDLVDVALPWTFTNTQTKWAPVFIPRDLRFLNEHAHWEEGEMWTMQTTVTSTCANDLVLSFCSKRGFLKVVIPAFAENYQVTVVDTIKFAPSYFYMRNRCKASGAEVTITEMKIGYGSCNAEVGPTLEPSYLPSVIPTPFPSALPSSYPTFTFTPTTDTPYPSLLPLPAPTPAPSLIPTKAPVVTDHPTSVPTIVPTFSPTSTPTNDTWTIGTWIPTPAPTAIPSPSPTITEYPTITAPPTVFPTLSLVPSLAPSLQPTTESFTCANVWDDLVDVALPWTFTNTQTKWAPVFIPRDLRFLNEHAHWEEGEMWTMQSTVTSTCANDLVLSFCSKRGFLKVVIPAFAENYQVTVVDTIKFAPSYFYMRNRCKASGAEVTITEMKIGYGSCNVEVGPTSLPTLAPTALPTSLTWSPTSAPTNDTWTIGTWIPTPAPTAIPSPSPTITEYPTITAPPTVLPTLSLVPSLAPSLQPTTESFTCANVWDDLVDVALPWTFTNTQTKWAPVFIPRDLRFLNEHAHWEEGEMWTMQTTVTSTCANDLVLSFCSKRGFLKVVIPAFAENYQVTVVDTIKFAPSYFYMRNRCKASGAEVTISEMKIGYGSCNVEVGPTSLPTLAPTALPTSLTWTPTSAPTNDTWAIGTWIPTPAPTAIPSPSPTITEYPTITAPPTVFPTLSLVPSLAPSLQPTTESFTCANVWDDLVDVALPWTFTNTQTKWAPVFIPRDLRFLNEHAHWEEGEMWTMQTTVTSTCANDLVLSFCSKRGFLKVVIPAFAENYQVTVVDTIKFAPSYFYMRNRCKASGAEVTITEMKIGYGSCNADVGPTSFPTKSPSFIPSSEPSFIPSPSPTNDTWTHGTWIPTPAPSAIPSPSPTITKYPTYSPRPTGLPTLSLVPSLAPSLQPTTENFTCANVWDDLVDVALPWTFTNTQTKWAPVFIPRDLRFLNEHAHWEEGEMWTMQTTVTSTCANDLVLSFCSKRGFLKVVIPALAENYQIAVVDTIKFTPSYFYMRNRCKSAGEVTVSEMKIGYGSCNADVGPTALPTLSPTLAPQPVPTRIPSPSPTNDTWTIGTWIPTPAPTAIPSPSPTITEYPTITAAPTVLPTLSLVPSLAPSLQPTTESFTCANVWDDLVDVALPWTFTNTQTKWAPVFIPRDLRFLNEHAHWEEGEMWTMQTTVTSTCANDLVLSFCSKRGFLKVVIPAFAENYQVTVVDTIKFAPSYFYMRNRCKASGAEVTITEMKIGYGSCNSDVGPTFLPTTRPTFSPSLIPSIIPSSLPSYNPTTFSQFPTTSPVVPSLSPTYFPTNDTWDSGTWIPTLAPTSGMPSLQPTTTTQPTLSLAPVMQPTVSNAPTYVPSIQPTTETFTCANVWDDLVDVAMPWTFTNTQTKWAPVFVPRKLIDLNEFWEEDEMWTLQTTVTSTCDSDLSFSFSSTHGFLKIVVPAFAEDYEVTVVDVIKTTPSYFYMRDTCVSSGAEVTFTDVKLGYGSCNSEVGPTVTPTSIPSTSLLPTASFDPSGSPTHPPTHSPTRHPTIIPTPVPTKTPTSFPSASPSLFPTPSPSKIPTSTPSLAPTHSLSPTFTPRPSQHPTISLPPTSIPLPIPSSDPTALPSALPTLLPSPLPTIFPSLVPTPRTPSPTSSPTESCPNELSKLHPRMKSYSGIAHGLSQTSNLNYLDGTITRPFGLLSGGAEPTTPFSFGVYLDDVLVGGRGGGGTTFAEQAEQISVIIKTSEIYRDKRNIEIAYQLRDGMGRSNVQLEHLELQINITNDMIDNVTMIQQSCSSLPNITSGIGVCDIEVPFEWFYENTSHVIESFLTFSYSSNHKIISENVFVTCMATPIYPSLDSANLAMFLPQHPLTPGSSFDVMITANTNYNILRAWQYEVSYNTDVIDYLSTSSNNNFTSPIVLESIQGVISVSNMGLSNEIAEDGFSSMNSGSDLYIGTLSFKVKSGTNNGVISNALKLLTVSMTNEDSIRFVTNTTGQVYDERGAYDIGQVSIITPSPVGIFSYAPINEMVNIAPFTGKDISLPIQTFLIFDEWAKPNVEISGMVSCTLTEAVSYNHILSVGEDSCQVIATSDHTAGSARVPVSVSYGVNVAEVDIIVWFPREVTLEGDDSTLNKIADSNEDDDNYDDDDDDDKPKKNKDDDSSSSDSSTKEDDADDDGDGCDLFQKTKVFAYGTFSNELYSRTIDVTDYVKFLSSDSDILSIVNGSSSVIEVLGEGDGNAFVTVSLFSTIDDDDLIEINPLAIQVTSSETVSLDQLATIIYANTSWIGGTGVVTLNSTVHPYFQFTQHLEGFGDEGYVQVYAEYSDGSWKDVTNDADIVILPEHNGLIELTGHSSFKIIDNSLDSTWCYPAVKVQWSRCNDTYSYQDFGFVKKLPPEVLSCKLVIDREQIAPIGDGATMPPFNRSDVAELTMTVSYDDGTSRDFSYDDRALLTIVQGDTLTQLDGNLLTVISDALITTSSDPDIIIQLTFPGLYDCSDTASTSVVKFDYLNISATHHPSSVNLGPISELREIACSGVFQRAQLSAIGFLTDETWADENSFSKWVAFNSSNIELGDFTARPCFRGNCRGLATTSAGSLVVTGEFGSKTTELPMKILGDRVNITSVGILDTIGYENTLHGLVNTTDNLDIEVNFTDGTSLVLSQSGQETSDWLIPSSLLSFDISHEQFVSVNNEGVLKLYGNYYTSIDVTARERCTNLYFNTKEFYANLDPDVHDVDLGHLYGPSLSEQTIGDYFDVEVRIQASEDEPLTAFQIKIIFDYDELHVDSDDFCGRMSGWGWNFECTSNDPEYELLMVGTCGLANAADCGTFNNNVVGFITFQAVGTGFIHLKGEVIKNMGNVTTTDDMPIFSGDAYFWVLPVIDVVSNDDEVVARQTFADNLYAAATLSSNLNLISNYTNASLSTNIKRTVDCDTMQGDTNGDCVCDVADVQIIQFYIGRQTNLSHLKEHQLFSLDANLDGIVDGADVHFLLRIVAYKYRFLSNYSTTPNPFTLTISMLTWQSFPSPQNQSNLWLELALDLNKELDMKFTYGNVTSSPDGLFIVPKLMDVGVFGAGGPPMITELDVPLVVIVETYNVFGNTSESRLCPFYCTRRIEMCRDAFGDSEDAFIPFKYPDLIVPIPTLDPTSAPSISPWEGTNINAPRSASANLFAIMAVAAALIAALIARHAYRKQKKAKNTAFTQFKPEAAPVANEGLVAGVFKKWKPSPPPPMQLKSVEYITDLQEPGIFEKGHGGDEGRRNTGEMLPGLFDQNNKMEVAPIPDFLALNKDFKFMSSRLADIREKPVLRTDRANSWESDIEDELPPPDAFSAPSPQKRDHSNQVSQLPAKYPGAPKLRIEKPKFSDEEESEEEEEAIDLRQDHRNEDQQNDDLDSSFDEFFSPTVSDSADPW